MHKEKPKEVNEKNCLFHNVETKNGTRRFIDIITNPGFDRSRNFVPEVKKNLLRDRITDNFQILHSPLFAS